MMRLSALTPEQITLLPPTEFQQLLQITKWNDLKVEQIKAIEENEILCAIAEAMLGLKPVKPAPEMTLPKSSGLNGLSAEHIELLSPEEFRALFEVTRWNTLRHEQLEAIERNTVFRAIATEVLDKAARARESRNLELPDERWEFLASVKSLNELSPEQISLLLSIEFIPLLKETRWNELSAEQIAAIEADEDLCEIANEMLQMDAELQPAGAIARSFPAEEEDDDGFSALSPRMNGNGKAKTS